MKNRKQIIADFYLDLLAQPYEWQIENFILGDAVLEVLATELQSDSETVRRIFKQLSLEDSK